MQISFLNPSFFLLLVLIPVLWFVPRKVDRKIQGVLRSLLLLLVIAALAKPVLLMPSVNVHQIFIVDHSGSVSVEQQAKADEVLSGLIDNVDNSEKVTVIALGGKKQGGQQQGGQQQDDDKQGFSNRIRVQLTGSESSLSAGLETALQQIPLGSRGGITLITDGLATDRDWGDVTRQLIERGIPVNVYALDLNVNDLYPAAIETDGIARVGQTVKASVTVIGSGDVTVTLKDDMANVLASHTARIDQRGVVNLEFEPKVAGFMSVAAEIVSAAQDSNASNNTLTTMIAVQEPLKVLYIGERMQGSVNKLQKLVGNGFVIDTPAQPLDSAFPLQNYQLVMVDDAPAHKLTEEFQQKLTRAVEMDGLGLLFSGGRASFGEGGYYQSTLAEVLPVEFEQRSEKRNPSVALAIILDSSGSMKGKPLELAKQVAMLSLKKLERSDLVGVVEFYGGKSWAVPMQPLNDKMMIERSIGRLQYGGSTLLMPAIEEAMIGLENVEARYKHILVISDAGIEDADPSDLIRELRKKDITLSTVLTSSMPDSKIMSSMANLGGGNFYAVTNRFNIVELDFKKPYEIKLPSYQTGLFHVAARSGDGWWGDVVNSELPNVSGYVQVKNRTGADVLMETQGSAHPLLSSWRYGLGRVSALMTEPVGPGTRSWQSWADYGRLLARVMTRTADDGNAFKYQLTRRGDQLHIDAVRNGGNDDQQPQLRLASIEPFTGTEQVTTSDGDALQVLELVEKAPGWFSTELSIAAQHPAALQATTATGIQHLLSPSLLSAESQVDPQSGLNLARLAQATGGVDFTTGENSAADIASSQIVETNESLSLQKLWPWLLLMALLIYLTELIYRRWPRSR